MKSSAKLWLSFLLVICSIAAQAETLDHMTQLWRARKYDQVIPLLLAFRNQPGNRTWKVDYLVGTSECRVAGRQKDGAAVLNYVLSNYRLPDIARTATEQEIQFCRQSGSSTHPEPPFFYVPVSGQVASGSLVAGKGGYEVASTEVTTSPVKAVPVPIDELKNRVFPADQGNQALQSAEKRLPGSSDGVVINGFVVVCNQHCAPPPKNVDECLLQYKAPLQSEFDIKMPTDLVTVYLAPDPSAVRDDALRLHGINLPYGTVAYSVYEDLSLVGIASYTCGSLAHELVHLSIRQNFGDSPPWMEEGLASEVAVANPGDKNFEFSDSWRDDMLRKHWNLRPTVAQLLTMNWTNYAANDVAHADQVAEVHAMAAVFIRYLDARKKLVPVYFALRDSRYSPASRKMRNDQAILQQQLKMNVGQIDADFVRWFKAPPDSDKPSSTPKGRDQPTLGGTHTPRAGNDPPQGGNEPAYPTPTHSESPNAPAHPLNPEGPNAPPHPPNSVPPPGPESPNAPPDSLE